MEKRTVEDTEQTAINPTDFVNIIGEYEYRNAVGSAAYYKAIELFEAEVLKKEDITAEKIGRTVWGFLKNWGKIPGKAPDLQKLASTLFKIVNELKANTVVEDSLLTFDFSAREKVKTIRRSFQRLKKVKGIGPTSTSKILHLTNPSLFVMWDDTIRHTLDLGEGAKDYLVFLRQMKTKGTRLEQVQKVKEIMNEYNKNLAVLLYEYYWEKYHKQKETVKRREISSYF